MPALIAHGKPCILHVTLNNNLQHYVVCYGFTGGEAFIADPAEGLKQVTTAALEKIWHSKTCLTLAPNEKFVKASDTQKAKKDLLTVIENTGLFVNQIIAIHQTEKHGAFRIMAAGSFNNTKPTEENITIKKQGSYSASFYNFLQPYYLKL